MGKTKPEIIVDAEVHKSFLDTSTSAAVGLIVGTVSENNDFYVAHFAETLEEEKRENFEHVEDDRQDEESLYRSSTFDTLPPATLAFHAKQVTRMLPGGLNIIGLYVVDAKESIFSFNTEPRVKNMISCVTKGILKNSWYDAGFEDASEKIFLHFNPATKKFTSKIFDCSTLKPRAIDLRPQKLTWSKLECEFDTVAAMHVSKKEAGAPLKKNLQLLMKSFQESLCNAKILINGQFPSKQDVFKEPPPAPHLPNGSSSERENKVEDLDGEDLGWKDEEEEEELEQEEEEDSQGLRQCKGHASKKSCFGSGDCDREDRDQSSSGRARVSPVHILFDKEPGILRCDTPVEPVNGGMSTRSASGNSSPNNSNGGREDEFINHLHVQGKITVLAYVAEGSSTSLMAERIRQDIIRSMASRIEMHCESLIDEESTTEPVHSVLVHHEIPRRVFVHLPHSQSLLVSDYLFPGEGPKDSLLSFKDILSIVVEDEEAVMIDKEHPFTNDLQIRGSVEELLSQADSDIKFAVEGFTTKKLLSGLFLFIAVLIFLAIVAPLISSFINDTSTHSASSKASASGGRQAKEF